MCYLWASPMTLGMIAFSHDLVLVVCGVYYLEIGPHAQYFVLSLFSMFWVLDSWTRLERLGARIYIYVWLT
jgi:hypothetical protein